MTTALTMATPLVLALPATLPTSLAAAAPLLGFALAGGALGTAYFWLLAANVRLYVAEGRARQSIALHVLRLGLGAAAFLGFAQAGAAPLLMALLGFLAARLVMVRLQGRVP